MEEYIMAKAILDLGTDKHVGINLKVDSTIKQQ